MMAVRSSAVLPFETSALRGKFKFDEPMSRHTSWRVGGPAQFFYLPADRQDVVSLLKAVPAEIPVHWIGLGSNMLVRDGGVEGVVVKTSKALANIEVRDRHTLYAEAGVSCAKVARVSAANQLSGAGFLAGVPGSFGGALAMNAGAFGGETWPLVQCIECVNRSGEEKAFESTAITYSYRHVELPEGYALLAGLLQLTADDSEADGKAEIKELLEKRNASQPIQSANAGSVFKNPEGDFAARIIEHLGLKGSSEGGARFSDIHANFIINDGDATATDIETLMTLAQKLAQQEMDIALEPEVRIIGRHG
jgi:UDP-N-acetylmuramate dehydrogenase